MSKQDKAVEAANSMIIDCPLTRHHTRRLKVIRQASAHVRRVLLLSKSRQFLFMCLRFFLMSSLETYLI